jgi:hypothetical protein
MTSRTLFRIQLMIVLIYSCSNPTNNCLIDEKTLVKRTETGNNIFLIDAFDQGSFGVSYQLRICKGDSIFLESIGLSGDEINPPRLDSFSDNTVYISYMYHHLLTDEPPIDIPFENAVVGRALLNKEQLKFKYHFSGVPYSK